MGELGALFNPGMRHELEERRSKAMRREEEGNARDGDLRIDLESGVAVINVPAADTDRRTASSPSRTDVQSEQDGPAPAATVGHTSGRWVRGRFACRRRHPSSRDRGTRRISGAAPPPRQARAGRFVALTAVCGLSAPDRSHGPSAGSCARQQLLTWSSTIPVACISA